MLKYFAIISFLVTIYIINVDGDLHVAFHNDLKPTLIERVNIDYKKSAKIQSLIIASANNLYEQYVLESIIQENLTEEEHEVKVSKTRKTANHYTFFENFGLFDCDKDIISDQVNFQNFSNWIDYTSLPKLYILNQIFRI